MVVFLVWPYLIMALACAHLSLLCTALQCFLVADCSVNGVEAPSLEDCCGVGGGRSFRQGDAGFCLPCIGETWDRENKWEVTEDRQCFTLKE